MFSMCFSAFVGRVAEVGMYVAGIVTLWDLARWK